MTALRTLLTIAHYKLAFRPAWKERMSLEGFEKSPQWLALLDSIQTRMSSYGQLSNLDGHQTEGDDEDCIYRLLSVEGPGYVISASLHVEPEFDDQYSRNNGPDRIQNLPMSALAEISVSSAVPDSWIYRWLERITYVSGFGLSLGLALYFVWTTTPGKGAWGLLFLLAGFFLLFMLSMFSLFAAWMAFYGLIHSAIGKPRARAHRQRLQTEYAEIRTLLRDAVCSRSDFEIVSETERPPAL